ncbi:response regulator transcription factor [Chryseobacterium sp. T1]
MSKSLLFFFGLLFQFSFCQTINSERLNTEIANFNDNYQYQKSIIRLEEIINNKRSTAYDRYNAYLQKSLTYKRLFNYPEVLENLNLALEVSENQNFHEEAEVRVLTEQMFVEFDSRKYEEARKLISILQLKNTNLLRGETQAFYLGAIAVMDIFDKKYDQAQLTLDDAIAILKSENPKHLPLIYSKMIGIAEHLRDEELAIKAFEEGIFYANKYKLDLYRISLYFTMSHFYFTIEDYKNAYIYQSKGSDVSSRYNAAFRNGQLTVLEKSIIQKRNNVEIDYQRKLKYALGFSSFILLAFLIVVIKLYKANRQKGLLIERENVRMRIELETLAKEIDDTGEEKLQTEDFDLTERQLEIIKLVREGKTNKEIGTELFISENTVKYHLKIIYNVLGIENRWDLKP